MRWVQYGCQTRKSLASTAQGKQFLKKIDANNAPRCKDALGLFSKYTELEEDGRAVREKRKLQRAQRRADEVEAKFESST
jgi:hypothetical protein